MSLPFALSSASIIGTTKEYEISRGFLNEAFEYQSSIETRTWVGGVAMFELAVKEAVIGLERQRLQHRHYLCLVHHRSKILTPT